MVKLLILKTWLKWQSFYWYKYMDHIDDASYHIEQTWSTLSCKNVKTLLSISSSALVILLGNTQVFMCQLSIVHGTLHRVHMRDWMNAEENALLQNVLDYTPFLVTKVSGDWRTVNQLSTVNLTLGSLKESCASSNRLLHPSHRRHVVKLYRPDHRTCANLHRICIVNAYHGFAMR